MCERFICVSATKTNKKCIRNEDKEKQKQWAQRELEPTSEPAVALFSIEIFFSGGGNNSGGDVRIDAIVRFAFFNESLCTKLFSNDIAGDWVSLEDIGDGATDDGNEVSSNVCFLCFMMRGGTGGSVSGGVSNDDELFDADIRIVYESSIAVAVNIVCSSTSSNKHNVPTGTLVGVIWSGGLTIEPLRLDRLPYSLLFTGFNCGDDKNTQ